MGFSIQPQPQPGAHCLPGHIPMGRNTRRLLQSCWQHTHPLGTSEETQHQHKLLLPSSFRLQFLAGVMQFSWSYRPKGQKSHNFWLQRMCRVWPNSQVTC